MQDPFQFILLNALPGLFGRAGGAAPRQQGPSVSNEGAGHLYQGDVPPTMWIEQEQQRSNPDFVSATGPDVQLRERGNRAFSERRYEDAIQLYTEDINRSSNALSYSNRSLAYSRLGRYEEAAADGRRVTELQPQFYKGYYRLGHALFMLKEYEEAMKELKKAIELCDTDSDREEIEKILAKCESKRVRSGPTATPSRREEGLTSSGCIRRCPATRQENAQTAFTLDDESERFSAVSALSAEVSSLRKGLSGPATPDLVGAAKHLCESGCGAELQCLMRSVDTESIEKLKDAATASQEQLRRAVHATDRSSFEGALQKRNDSLQKLWTTARTIRCSLDRIASLSDAQQSIAKGLSHSTSTEQPARPTTTEEGRAKLLQGVKDKVQKLDEIDRTLRQRLEALSGNTNSALRQYFDALASEREALALAQEAVQEREALKRSLAEDLRTAEMSWPAGLTEKSRQLVNTLRPRVDGTCADELAFHQEAGEGEELLMQEAQIERDRLQNENQRIRAQAELEWLRVQEEDESKIAKVKRSVEAARERLNIVNRKQEELRLRILSLVKGEHPELAWKAAAGGNRVMKWIKGSGLWVKESFSDFQILGVLSSTPSAKVYRARNRRGNECALKEIPMQSDKVRRRFQNEVNIVAGMRNHPCIVRIEGVFFDGPFAYIIMPYYPMGNLKTFLESRGPLSWWKLQEIFRQIVSGVSFLHERGIVHGDLKPSNVLMKDERTPVLTDFGLAREIGRFIVGNGDRATETLTESLKGMGTQSYMAPEVLQGVNTTRSDIWSLGVLLLTCANQNAYLTNPDDVSLLPPVLFPAEGTRVEVQAMSVGGSERLSEVISTMLVGDPKKRPNAPEILSHPYFSVSLVQDLAENNQLVESNQKIEAFRTYLHAVRTGHRDTMLISVLRNEMVESVTSIFSQVQEQSLLGQIFVVFRGEQGIDEGGLTTEMLNLYFQQAISKGRLLIHSEHEESSDNDIVGGSVGGIGRAQYIPNADPAIPAVMFQVMGKVMLKCIIENRPLPVQLNCSVLKHFLGVRPTLLDLEEYDRVQAHSLRRLALLPKEDLADADLTFGEFPSSFLEKFQGGRWGKDSPVTEENVSDYIECRVQHELIEKRIHALNAMREGFQASNILKPHLQLLSPIDLTLLLCGQQHLHASEVVGMLDFSSFPARSDTPRHLRETVQSFSQNNLRRFLRLCTSYATIPISGLRHKIKVLCTGDPSRLPVGHTCVYQLDLPDYNDKAILQEKLGLALAQVNDGFHIV